MLMGFWEESMSEEEQQFINNCPFEATWLLLKFRWLVLKKLTWWVRKQPKEDANEKDSKLDEEEEIKGVEIAIKKLKISH